MDIDTPSSPPPVHRAAPARRTIIQPATPLQQHAAPPSSPDLLSSIHAPTLQDALQPKSKPSKRTNTDSPNPTSQPLRLRPTPNTDTASKLEQARSLLEEVYHTQGIDKQETGHALTAIDNIRRACGYPHLGSSRDPWNSTAPQQPTTTAIQSELNALREDLDQKFTTLTNLLSNNSNNGGHTGASYAEALMQSVAEHPPPPTGNNNGKAPQAKKRQSPKQKKDTPPPNTPTFHERRLIIQPQTEIDPSTWRPIQYRDAFNQQLRSAGAEEKIAVAAVTLSRSGNIILTAKDGCTAEDLIKYRDHWMNNTFSGFRKDEKWTKVIAHGVPAYVFGEDMDALHQEITNFNENTELAAPPRWLTRKEAREGKLHSSILLCFRTKPEADRAIKHGLLIGAVQTRCAAYRDTQPNSQCNSCQGYGHHSTVCRKKARCQLCAGDHNTRQHICPTCQTTGKPCSHTVLKCANCQEPHRANSPTCQTLIDINQTTKDNKKTPNQETTTPPNPLA